MILYKVLIIKYVFLPQQCLTYIKAHSIYLNKYFPTLWKLKIKLQGRGACINNQVTVHDLSEEFLSVRCS